MVSETLLDTLKQAIVFAICEPTDDRTDLDILEQLHTDVISRAQFKWSQSVDETRECLHRKSRVVADAHQRGMLFVGGVTVSALYLDNDKGTHLLTKEQLSSMATRSTTNELVDLGGYYHGCINNPSYLEYVKNYVRIIIDGGVDGIHFDEADSRWFHHRPYECFCDHCNSGFRDWLAARHSKSNLAESFGVQDLMAFNYRDYLQSHGWDQCPGQSPLHREWWLFQLEACRQKFVELVNYSQGYAEERLGHRLVNTANVYDPLWLPERCLEAPHVEYVMVGSCLEIRLRRNGRFVQENRLPPSYSYVPMHLATRSCTPDRPVTFFIDWPPGVDFMLRQPIQRQRDILKYLFAEAYACGVYFHAPYKSCYARWTGPIDVLTQYTSFYVAQEDCFHGVHPAASVGVLYSYASSIWDHFPMELAPSAKDPIHWLQYYGVGQALIDAGICFDSVFVGDGHIMGDRLNADQLSRYEVVIVPYWYSVSPRQVGLLHDFAVAGGKLLIIGPWALVDTEYRSLQSSNMQELLIRAGAKFLESCDFEEYLAQPKDSVAKLISARVEELAGRSLHNKLGAQLIEVLLTGANDGSALYVHAINRDLTDDGFVGKTNVPVSIPLPKGLTVNDQTAELTSPDEGGARMVRIRSTPDGIRFVLPAIETYTLLKLKCGLDPA